VQFAGYADPTFVAHTALLGEVRGVEALRRTIATDSVVTF
jgi:hypothetical protein